MKKRNTHHENDTERIHNRINVTAIRERKNKIKKRQSTAYTSSSQQPAQIGESFIFITHTARAHLLLCAENFITSLEPINRNNGARGIFSTTEITLRVYVRILAAVHDLLGGGGAATILGILRFQTR